MFEHVLFGCVLILYHANICVQLHITVCTMSNVPCCRNVAKQVVHVYVYTYILSYLQACILMSVRSEFLNKLYDLDREKSQLYSDTKNIKLIQKMTEL